MPKMTSIQRLRKKSEFIFVSRSAISKGVMHAVNRRAMQSRQGNLFQEGSQNDKKIKTVRRIVEVLKWSGDNVFEHTLRCKNPGAG